MSNVPNVFHVAYDRPTAAESRRRKPKMVHPPSKNVSLPQLKSTAAAVLFVDRSLFQPTIEWIIVL